MSWRPYVIRVLLVDDHASFRESLAFMMEREPDMTVVAEAGALAEAREVMGNLPGGVDIAVVDVSLPDGEGTELVGELRAANPHGAVLILSGISDRARFARAVEAGAGGILHKSARTKSIIEAARRLHAGEELLSLREVVEMFRIAGEQREEDRKKRVALEKLTPRETEILRALAEGLSDREIAGRLQVSNRTVRTHMVNILAKLELNSRLQALVFALRHGIVEIH